MVAFVVVVVWSSLFLLRQALAEGLRRCKRFHRPFHCVNLMHLGTFKTRQTVTLHGREAHLRYELPKAERSINKYFSLVFF